MLYQRRRRLADVVQMLYTFFVFAEILSLTKSEKTSSKFEARCYCYGLDVVLQRSGNAIIYGNVIPDTILMPKNYNKSIDLSKVS